jgi:S1-C subfamily serine protease
LESGITFEYENKYKLIQAGLITEEDDLHYFSQNAKILIIKDVDVLYETFSHLLPGDIVIKINNKLISNAFEAEKELNDSPCLVADIMVKRNGNLINKKIKLKNAVDETTATIFQWENATFQDTNITTRRYYSIKEEGVLLSKYKPGSSFSKVGNSSSKINGGKGALITHVNGIRIKNLSDFRAVLSETRKTSISILYYDYICNLPLKFALCDVSYESFDEQNMIDFIPKEDAA